MRPSAPNHLHTYLPTPCSAHPSHHYPSPHTIPSSQVPHLPITPHPIIPALTHYHPPHGREAHPNQPSILPPTPGLTPPQPHPTSHRPPSSEGRLNPGSGSNSRLSRKLRPRRRCVAQVVVRQRHSQCQNLDTGRLRVLLEPTSQIAPRTGTSRAPLLGHVRASAHATRVLLCSSLVGRCRWWASCLFAFHKASKRPLPTEAPAAIQKRPLR